MQIDLYIPGPPGPAHSMTSADLPGHPAVGDYLTVPEWYRGTCSASCVRVTHVPVDLDIGIEVTDRLTR